MNIVEHAVTGATQVQEAFDYLEASGHRVARLLDTSPLYRHIPPTMTKPASKVPEPGMRWFVTVLDAEGQEVRLPSDWEELDHLTHSEFVQFRVTPNAVIRVGEHLIVSEGLWNPLREVTVDGIDMVEFMSFAEEHRMHERSRQRFIDEHPEIAAAMPSWANEVAAIDFVTGDDEDEPVTVEFSRKFGDGSVQLTRLAEYENGRLTYLDDTAAPVVLVQEIGVTTWPVTSPQMRALSAALCEAADVLDSCEGKATTLGEK